MTLADELRHVARMEERLISNDVYAALTKAATHIERLERDAEQTRLAVDAMQDSLTRAIATIADRDAARERAYARLDRLEAVERAARMLPQCECAIVDGQIVSCARCKSVLRGQDDAHDPAIWEQQRVAVWAILVALYGEREVPRITTTPTEPAPDPATALANLVATPGGVEAFNALPDPMPNFALAEEVNDLSATLRHYISQPERDQTTEGDAEARAAIDRLAALARNGAGA